MNPRHMVDDLDALDARLGALNNANRSFEQPAAPPPSRFAAMRPPEQVAAAPAPTPAAPAPMVPPPSPPATSELPRGFINDLRSWSSNYRFTPEMEYIKITRSGPAMYKGVNATGWLCDVYQPIDEQYVGSVWGGGTYIIVAYQNAGGGAREVARGYTQINGNPRAYRGIDGQPVLFPTDGNDNRSGLPGVPAPPAANGAPVQHSQQPGQGVPFPVVNNYPPPSPAPAIDLISLAEKFSGNKQEAKSLEVLQAAQAQNNEFYKDALNRSVDEQKQLREQLIMMQQNQSAPMQNAIEMYRAQMETRERSHTDTLKQMTAEHTAQLQALRQQSDKAIEEQRRGFDSTLQNMREESRSREQAVRDSWRVESDNLRRELDNLRATNLSEMNRMRDDNRRDLDAARADAERRENNARENARMTYENQIRVLESQLNTMKEQFEQRMGDVRLMHAQNDTTSRSTFDLQLSQRDTEINRLRDELTVARSEVNTLRTDLNEKRDPMTTLNEVATLTQTFQSITGQGAAPPKEEEPTGFVAQLAKYAPSIGEHLIKPTMKPIAEVVETVRERERREEELRRDILMRRQALQQRPGGPMPQAPMYTPQQQQQMMQQQAMMQQQQQAMMQQQMMQQQQQRAAYVPAPVASVRPRPPAPTGIPMPGPVSQPAPVPTLAPEAASAPVAEQPPEIAALASLLTKDLLDHVEGALTSNTSPNDLADQMKMGASFGMIDPNIIETVKATPRDTVVGLFLAAAEQYNAVNLASPRGEEYLAAIHAALQK